MITISDGILNIPEGERFIGFTGDNLHTQKSFFIPFHTQSGWLYRLYLTFDDGRHNYFLLPATVSSEGTLLAWNIEESHILKSGLIKAQIKAFSEEQEVYHTNSDVFVAGKATEEDDEFKNGNSEFLHYESTLNELYGKMEEASAKMPYVGTNGNWYTYDVNSKVYVDSGKPSAAALADNGVTPEKLDRKYWQKSEIIPVTGYDYFDSILDNTRAADTVYRIEFSGLSPIKAVVGEGSFIAVTCNDQSGLLLVNITNGDNWYYAKESYELVSCGQVGSNFKFLEAFESLTDLKDYNFEQDKLYHFLSDGELTSLIGEGYCYGRYYETMKNSINTRMLQVFNSTTLNVYLVDLTNSSVSALNASVDQTFSPVSTKPQSGKAVYEAIKGLYNQLDGLEDLLAEI